MGSYELVEQRTEEARGCDTLGYQDNAYNEYTPYILPREFAPDAGTHEEAATSDSHHNNFDYVSLCPLM